MICPNTGLTIPREAPRVKNGRVWGVDCPHCNETWHAASHCYEAPRLVGAEGGIEYWQYGEDIRRALPGCLPKHYCTVSQWPCSIAARRIRGEFDRNAREALSRRELQDIISEPQKKKRTVS